MSYKDTDSHKQMLKNNKTFLKADKDRNHKIAKSSAMSKALDKKKGEKMKEWDRKDLSSGKSESITFNSSGKRIAHKYL